MSVNGIKRILLSNLFYSVTLQLRNKNYWYNKKILLDWRVETAKFIIYYIWLDFHRVSPLNPGNRTNNEG